MDFRHCPYCMAAKKNIIESMLTWQQVRQMEDIPLPMDSDDFWVQTRVWYLVWDNSRVVRNIIILFFFFLQFPILYLLNQFNVFVLLKIIVAIRCMNPICKLFIDSMLIELCLLLIMRDRRTCLNYFKNLYSLFRTYD